MGPDSSDAPLARRGGLDRHTDQVDPTLGVGVGDLMRVHIPLKTNPEAIFTVWNQDGQPVQQHMGLGKLWALDVRWPHRAQNNGADERIHLVLDVQVDSAIQDCLEPAAATPRYSRFRRTSANDSVPPKRASSASMRARTSSSVVSPSEAMTTLLFAGGQR